MVWMDVLVDKILMCSCDLGLLGVFDKFYKYRVYF